MSASITGQSDLEAACARLVASGSPALPLMRAAADGLISVAWAFDPSAEVPWGRLKRNTLPTVLVVGDDPEPERPSLGPTGWSLLAKAQRWASAVIVHGAAGRPEHYQEAILGARTRGRCVLIETASRHATAWAQALSGRPMLIIAPGPAGTHPTLRREAVH